MRRKKVYVRISQSNKENKTKHEIIQENSLNEEKV